MDPKLRLAEIRASIASLDRDLARALMERAKLSKEIRALFEPAGPPPDVDRDFLRIVDDAPDGDLPKEALRTLLAEVAATGRALERPVRVAYFGQEGGFCNQMVRQHFGMTAAL